MATSLQPELVLTGPDSMFRITRLTDYGVLLMTQFAAEPQCLRNAADLSTHAHVPMPTVSKILKMLLKQGLLESIRGAGGGYRLTRRPEEVSVQDIIVALEGPIALTECNLIASECEQKSHCTVSSNWRRINFAIRHALAGITLADMTRPNFQPEINMQKRSSAAELKRA